MLYNRKTKSRSADFLGVTLVYTIESFKYSLLFLRRYTDSVIPYGNLDPILEFIYGYFYKSVFFIIFYGVIAKIKNNLVNYLLYSVNNCALAPKLKLYSPAVGNRTKMLQNRTTGFIQINIFPFNRQGFLIKLRKLNDIPNKRNKTLCLIINIAGKPV